MRNHGTPCKFLPPGFVFCSPLGLSDKDVQLEFDGFPPKSPSPSAETLREHPESPLNEQLMSPKVENQNGNEEE